MILDRSAIAGLLIALLVIALPIFILLGRPDEWSIPGITKSGDVDRDRTHFEEFIGEFKEKNTTFPDVPLVVELKLYADVPAADKGEFENVMAHHEPKLRQAVASVLQTVPSKDLMEPTLTTLKRKVKVAMQGASGSDRPLFESLVIPEFSAYTPVN